VSDITAVQTFFAERPAFHILVNNAGTNRPKPLWEVTQSDYDAVYDLNVKSAFFVAQACVQQMMAEKIAGSLIHMGSQMGHVGGPNRSLYCGSKWALEGMNKAFALDLAPHGVRSNTIAPTFIETPMTKPFFEDENFKAHVLTKIKLGRIGQVEDLMGAVLFLASDASAMMTGTSMIIDGGWTAD
jgi:NAD(P)-dependent dehydrogenase (short-subunit alcohol dehydrogenase family)